MICDWVLTICLPFSGKFRLFAGVVFRVGCTFHKWIESILTTGEGMEWQLRIEYPAIQINPFLIKMGAKKQYEHRHHNYLV